MRRTTFALFLFKDNREVSRATQSSTHMCSIIKQKEELFEILRPRFILSSFQMKSSFLFISPYLYVLICLLIMGSLSILSIAGLSCNSLKPFTSL